MHNSSACRIPALHHRCAGVARGPAATAPLAPATIPGIGAAAPYVPVPAALPAAPLGTAVGPRAGGGAPRADRKPAGLPLPPRLRPPGQPWRGGPGVGAKRSEPGGPGGPERGAKQPRWDGGGGGAAPHVAPGETALICPLSPLRLSARVKDLNLMHGTDNCLWCFALHLSLLWITLHMVAGACVPRKVRVLRASLRSFTFYAHWPSCHVRAACSRAQGCSWH